MLSVRLYQRYSEESLTKAEQMYAGAYIWVTVQVHVRVYINPNSRLIPPSSPKQ